jgi:hypothetical protein
MDCHICYNKKPSLKTLNCKHSLCSNCYLRLANTICPFCRETFAYTADEIKQRAKIGLKNGYQSNDLQPGLTLPDSLYESIYAIDEPDEFVLSSLSPSLSLSLSPSQLSPNTIFRRNQRIENQYLIMENDINSTRSKKNKKKHSNDNQANRLSIEEINDRRYNIARREYNKWTKKERRLKKMNFYFVDEYEL